MQQASNNKTTALIISLMVIGIVAVIAMSFATGRYDSAATKADTGFSKLIGN